MKLRGFHRWCTLLRPELHPLTLCFFQLEDYLLAKQIGCLHAGGRIKVQAQHQTQPECPNEPQRALESLNEPQRARSSRVNQMCAQRASERHRGQP